MSVFRERELVCPHCDERFTKTVAVSINPARGPLPRQQILDGTFQRFDCPACGGRVVAEGPFLYVHFDRSAWMGCFPSAWESSWRALEGEPARTLERVRSATRYHRLYGVEVRAVFGLAAVAEKIRCFDAGIDDRQLERFKLLVIRRDQTSLDPDERLRLVAVEGGELTLAAGRGDAYRVPRAAFDASAADDAFVGEALSSDYVDLGRLVIPGRESAPRGFDGLADPGDLDVWP